MKRLHVHMAVENVNRNIECYKALFATDRTVVKDDCARWQLEDPRVNFASSARGAGVEHLGIQVGSADELAEVESPLARAEEPVVEQAGTACCHARSDKYWTQDPEGIGWELFHTLDSIPPFSNQAGPCEPSLDPAQKKARSGCCAPGVC